MDEVLGRSSSLLHRACSVNESEFLYFRSYEFVGGDTCCSMSRLHQVLAQGKNMYTADHGGHQFDIGTIDLLQRTVHASFTCRLIFCRNNSRYFKLEAGAMRRLVGSTSDVV